MFTTSPSQGKDPGNEVVMFKKHNKRYITIFWEKDTSAKTGFHVDPLHYPGRIGIWSWDVGFSGAGEENRRTWRKTLGEPTTNSTHIWQRAGIEPGPHWWEAGYWGERSQSPLCHWPCLTKIGAGEPQVYSTATFLFLFLILWEIENSKLGLC